MVGLYFFKAKGLVDSVSVFLEAFAWWIIRLYFFEAIGLDGWSVFLS